MSSTPRRRSGPLVRPRPTALRAGMGACAVLGLFALVACSGSSNPMYGDRPQTATPSSQPPVSATTAPGAPSGTKAPSKVLVVIEENHTLGQMQSGMPYLAGLSARYGYATHWQGLAHPSLPNYLAIAGGSMFGVTDDRSPAAHAGDVGDAVSVFDQAIDAGKTAGTYAESIPEHCHPYDFPDRADGKPLYAVRHNPWTYFDSGRSDCLAHDVGVDAFASDAANNQLPNVSFLIPNLAHDAHDGSLATADAWLKEQLAPVLASKDFMQGRLVVVVTADEDDRSADNTVLTSVLTPALSAKVVDTPLNHYSLTRFIADVIGVAPLGEGATAPDLAAAFGLPRG
ncbi:alkaline phosphatase family protein [Nocardioides sp. Bht2]|uniref:alkaline phosphatase family protein n=1 Tax=Nocardioides sp. Bht2 TaxID=3392297 RepID=UPI0039B5F5EE